LSSQIAAQASLPKYNAAKLIGDRITIAIQAQSMMVDKGIAIIFDNKNNKGN